MSVQLLISLLFLFCILFLGQGVEIKEVNYEIRHEKLLGLELTYSLFKVTVDEDLYLYDSFQCTPECQSLPTDCTDCDYTDINNCGYLHPESLSNITEPCECLYSETYCSDQTYPYNVGFRKIETGKTYGPYTLRDGVNYEQMFRFHFDTPCHGIRIRSTEIYGSVTQFVAIIEDGLKYSYGPFPDTVICPKDAFYKFGTYVILIWMMKEQASKFILHVETKDFGNETVPIQIPRKAEGDLYGSYELFEGTSGPYIFERALQFISFRLIVSSCKQFMFRKEQTSYTGDNVGSTGVLFQMDQPGYVPTLYHINAPYNLVFGVCPKPNTNQSSLYLTIVNTEVPMEILITLSSNPELWTRKKISDHGLFDGHHLLSGSIFELQCVGSNNRVTGTWHCRRGGDYWGASCLELWAGVPTKQSTALWPRPLYFLRQDFTTFGSLSYETEENITRSDQIIGGMLLELVSGSQITEPYPYWRTSLISNCSLVFPSFSTILNENGQPVIGTYKFKEQPSECDHSKFDEVSILMDQLIQELSTLNETYLILSWRYMIDIQTFSESWQGCDDYIQWFLDQQKVVEDYENTKGCPREMFQIEDIKETDPCCNDDLKWEMCCAERTVSFETTNYLVDHTKSSQCGDKQCLETLLNDYIFYKTIGDSLTGCSSVVKEPLRIKNYHSLRFLSSCKEKFFGTDGVGKKCLNDDDCLFRCHEIQRVCVYRNSTEIETVYQLFWECIDENIPGTVRDYLFELQAKGVVIDHNPNQIPTQIPNPSISLRQSSSVSKSQEDFIQLLNTTYRFDDCVAWFGRSNHSSHYFMDNYLSSCLLCYDSCFDDSCLFPLRCENTEQYGRTESICVYSENPYYRVQSRCSDNACNWNNSINSEEECISLFKQKFLSTTTTTTNESKKSYNNLYYNNNLHHNHKSSLKDHNHKQNDELKFCGVCETPSSCQVVSLNLEDCKGEVCVVNGKVDLTIKNTKDCKDIGYCSMNCETCDTIDGCLNHGVCSDTEHISYIKQVNNVPGNPLPSINKFDGYCVSPLSPWNNPDCSIDETQTGSMPTPVGCLRMYNKSYCLEKLNHSWIPYSTTKEECLSFKTCEEVDIPTRLTSIKDSEQCSLCNGNSKNVYTWESGQWIPGKVRNLEVVLVSWSPVETFQSTLDFDGLSTHITQSNTESYSMELQTEVQCKLNPLKTVIEKILCVCGSSEENCFDEQQNLEIAVGKLCFGDSYTLIAPPSILSFNSSSLSSGCLLLSVSTLLASEVGSPPSVSLSTSFRKKPERGDNVKNIKGEFVGKLIGNGVQLNQRLDVHSSNQSSDDENQRINNFELCISIDDKYLPNVYHHHSFTEYDFAKRVSQSEVRPLSISVYFSSSNSLCALITNSYLRNITYLENNNNNNNNNNNKNELISVYPIIRIKQWEDQSSSNSLSSGEIAVYCLMLILYLMLLFFKLYDEIYEGLKLKNSKRWISWLLLSCVFVRIVYFIVLLSNTLPEDEDTMTEFLLIEIPTYLYFLGIVMASLVWYAVRSVTSSHDVPGVVMKRFLLILFLTIIFVLSIMTSWELSGESETYRCGGRVSSPADTSTQENLRLSYRIVLSGASIGVCVAISYFGGAIWLTFYQSRGIGERVSFQVKIYRVTLVSTISLVTQSLFFIIYSEFEDPSYEWLLFLILVEWFPLVIIFYNLQSAKSPKLSKDSMASTDSKKIQNASSSAA